MKEWKEGSRNNLCQQSLICRANPEIKIWVRKGAELLQKESEGRKGKEKQGKRRDSLRPVGRTVQMTQWQSTSVGDTNPVRMEMN